MELKKNYRKLTTALSRFWHRKAGPMNWKNPVRVVAYIGWEVFNVVAFLVGEWVRYGIRAGQILLAIPPTAILFSGGVWFAVWFRSVYRAGENGHPTVAKVRMPVNPVPL